MTDADAGFEARLFYEDDHCIVINEPWSPDLAAALAFHHVWAPDSIITGPPVNSGRKNWGRDTKGKPVSDSMSRTDYVETVRGWAKAMVSIGTIARIAVHTQPMSNMKGERWPVPAIWHSALIGADATYHDSIVWPNARRRTPNKTTHRLPEAPALTARWEEIMLYSTGGWLHPRPDHVEDYWSDPDGGWTEICDSVWDEVDFDRKGEDGKSNYVGQHPVALVRALVRLITWPATIILDPFCGGGTTLLAARSMGRYAIGVDPAVEMCEKTVDRLRQQTLGAPEPIEQPTLEGFT